MSELCGVITFRKLAQTFSRTGAGFGRYDRSDSSSSPGGGLEDRFNIAFLTAVEDTISDLLGPRVVGPFFAYIATFGGFRKGDIPARRDEFFISLDRTFGKAGPILGKNIVKRLYAGLGLRFVEKKGAALLEYVREAETSLQGT